MSYFNKMKKPINNNKGITIVLVAILLFVLVGFVGLALDVSYMYVVKGQLQNAADAGALAGAAKLNNVYGSATCDPSLFLSAVKAEAKRIAEKNNAAGSSLTDAVELSAGVNELTDDNDITIGYWDAATATYTPTVTNPNAVQVRVRRTTESPLGQVRLFVSRLMGWSTMGTAAEAVADAEPAPLLPIVVNEYWLHRNADQPSQIPYPGEVHRYPNSFVRTTPVGPLNPADAEKAYGKIFAIMGAQAHSNVPKDETKGAQDVDGYVNLDSRTHYHDGSGKSWYDLLTKSIASSGCTPPDYLNVFSNPSIEKNTGSIDSTKFDESMGYLHKGYKYVPPTAVRERYRAGYTTSNYPVPPEWTSSAPFATVPYFSGSGGGGQFEKKYDGKKFEEVFPPGEQIVAMVYDGTFVPDVDPRMPNAVTNVGYVLLQIDGYSSKDAHHLTKSDKTTIDDKFWESGGNTVYAHAVTPIVEPSGTFEEFYAQINGLRWRGAKVRLVMNRGIF